MLLPLQNGMAAVNSVANVPAQAKQVCHEMNDQHQQHVKQMDMQQHVNGCCDKDMNCQQQCSDCKHFTVVSVIPTAYQKPHSQGLHNLYSVENRLPDSTSHSFQFRPPRA